MSRPIIALLTDFGTADHYAGTMKGVVLGLCPDATLVDISHDIPPHDVMTASIELAACYKYFPAGTIFLVVVDPGVGSARRGLVAEAGDYRFVAPDNGVLTERLPGAAAQARHRVDGAALRAADGEPHVRGARPIRARRRMARARHRADGDGAPGVHVAAARRARAEAG